MIEIVESFDSTQEAVRILGTPPPDWQATDTSVGAGPRYKYPFGLWFRGEGREYSNGVLVPSVFRKMDGKIYDEVSLYNLFRLRANDYRANHRTPFDWLCLMQHYGLPTRLLDWTESPLIALYFATCNARYHDKHDGWVYVLDARSLNQETNVKKSHNSGIHVPESFNVVIRSECACRPILESVLNSNAVRNCDNSDSLGEPDLSARGKDLQAAISSNELAGVLHRLRTPTAVYPFRSNDRMIAQYGLFTVHGGKLEQKPPRSLGTTIGDPIGLSEVNNNAARKVVWRFRVLKEAKEEILKQLEHLGIHEGTLYPEIEQQAAYSKRIWLVDEQEDSP